MSQPERQQPDREQQLDDKEEMAAQRTASSAAIQQAAKEHRQDRRKFVDELRNIGIDGEDAQKIADEFGVEMAGVFALANEDKDDYRRHKWLGRNKRERLKSSRDPGYLADRHPEFQALARGEHTRQDTTGSRSLTQREKHKLHGAFEAKTALHSLARDGEGLSAVSEITAVTEHRRQTEAEDDDDSGGLVNRIFG